MFYVLFQTTRNGWRKCRADRMGGMKILCIVGGSF